MFGGSIVVQIPKIICCNLFGKRVAPSNRRMVLPLIIGPYVLPSCTITLDPFPLHTHKWRLESVQLDNNRGKIHRRLIFPRQQVSKVQSVRIGWWLPSVYIWISNFPLITCHVWHFVMFLHSNWILLCAWVWWDAWASAPFSQPRILHFRVFSVCLVTGFWYCKESNYLFGVGVHGCKITTEE